MHILQALLHYTQQFLHHIDFFFPSKCNFLQMRQLVTLPFHQVSEALLIDVLEVCPAGSPLQVLG